MYIDGKVSLGVVQTMYYHILHILVIIHGWQPWNVVSVWIFLVIFCILFHTQHKRFPRKKTAHLSINSFLHNHWLNDDDCLRCILATLLCPNEHFTTTTISPSMLNDQSWNIFCLLNEHDINYYFMHVTECHEAFFIN